MGTLASMTALQAELDFILDLADECAEVSMHYWRRGIKVLGLREKPMGGGPITMADTEINDRIVAALRSRFPDDGVLAEESADDGQWRGRPRCWYVDPIDGTREFAFGRPFWTIQIGLCVAGVPTMGVVLEPASEHRSWAVNSEELRLARHVGPDGEETDLTPKDAALEDIRLIGGYLFPGCRQLAIRKALEVEPERAKAVGSVGVRVASVARGDANLYVQAPGHTKMWDTCAPAALVLAAGGRVTDLRGQPLDYEAEAVTHPCGVLASQGGVHDEVLRRIAPLLADWG